MKAKIEFKLPKDMYELQNFLKADNYLSVILEFNAFLNMNIDSLDISEHEQAVYSIVKKEFKTICLLSGVSVFEDDIEEEVFDIDE